VLERPPIDQQVHDLIDEANLLLLEMMLPGGKARTKAAGLVARLLECAERASEAGRDKSAQHLREVASMLDNEASKAGPT
jgi:hypothetical protein